ncbi:MAG TPA: site-2 protease family protein [Myxococcota bacterium]|nr:site-2 protease family protein [Myxococcota bacterium]
MTDPALAISYYVVFVFSVTLHEAAHAFVALRGGDPTAYHGGQVSLSPLPHMRREPFGMVVLPILSVIVSGWPFGYASAPYDPAWADAHPRRAAWMALAGPGANALLVLLSWLAIRAGLAGGLFQAPESISFSRVAISEVSPLAESGALLLSTFFSMNLLLAILNLIPVPPLDGAGALPLLLSPEATRRYRALSRSGFAIFGILLAWRLLDVLFDPIFLTLVNALHPDAHYG